MIENAALALLLAGIAWCIWQDWQDDRAYRHNRKDDR